MAGFNYLLKGEIRFVEEDVLKIGEWMLIGLQMKEVKEFPDGVRVYRNYQGVVVVDMDVNFLEENWDKKINFKKYTSDPRILVVNKFFYETNLN